MENLRKTETKHIQTIHKHQFKPTTTKKTSNNKEKTKNGTLLEHCWNIVGTLLEHCWNIVGTLLEQKNLETTKSSTSLGPLF